MWRSRKTGSLIGWMSDDLTLAWVKGQERITFYVPPYIYICFIQNLHMRRKRGAATRMRRTATPIPTDLSHPAEATSSARDSPHLSLSPILLFAPPSCCHMCSDENLFTSHTPLPLPPDPILPLDPVRGAADTAGQSGELVRLPLPLKPKLMTTKRVDLSNTS